MEKTKQAVNPNLYKGCSIHYIDVSHDVSACFSGFYKIESIYLHYVRSLRQNILIRLKLLNVQITIKGNIN